MPIEYRKKPPRFLLWFLLILFASSSVIFFHYNFPLSGMTSFLLEGVTMAYLIGGE